MRRMILNVYDDDFITAIKAVKYLEEEVPPHHGKHAGVRFDGKLYGVSYTSRSTIVYQQEELNP